MEKQQINVGDILWISSCDDKRGHKLSPSLYFGCSYAQVSFIILIEAVTQVFCGGGRGVKERLQTMCDCSASHG